MHKLLFVLFFQYPEAKTDFSNNRELSEDHNKHFFNRAVSPFGRHLYNPSQLRGWANFNCNKHSIGVGLISHWGVLVEHAYILFDSRDAGLDYFVHDDFDPFLPLLQWDWGWKYSELKEKLSL